MGIPHAFRLTTGSENMYKQSLGRKGEDTAAKWLENNGYTILIRNYRCKVGEIDIIAKKGNTLVFVEVKTRSSTKYGLPQESVSWRKQNKIRQVALYYLKEYRPREMQYRFDVIAILELGGKQRIKIIENAF
jgi:putative endonuclease